MIDESLGLRDDPHYIPNKMDYGKAIRIARAMSNLQQKDVAERSKLDSSYVSLIEAGKRKPSAKAIESLSEAFAIPQPLFELLASESQDLDIAKPEQLEELGRELVELLLESKNE